MLVVFGMIEITSAVSRQSGLLLRLFVVRCKHARNATSEKSNEDAFVAVRKRLSVMTAAKLQEASCSSPVRSGVHNYISFTPKPIFKIESRLHVSQFR
jgi:hypothetical protein